MGDSMILAAEFSFAQAAHDRAQVFVIQQGNIVANDLEHASKLGKRAATVNRETGTIGEYTVVYVVEGGSGLCRSTMPAPPR
jgi:hypothetical protein